MHYPVGVDRPRGEDPDAAAPFRKPMDHLRPALHLFFQYEPGEVVAVAACAVRTVDKFPVIDQDHAADPRMGLRQRMPPLEHLPRQRTQHLSRAPIAPGLARVLLDPELDDLHVAPRDGFDMWRVEILAVESNPFEPVEFLALVECQTLGHGAVGAAGQEDKDGRHGRHEW